MRAKQAKIRIVKAESRFGNVMLSKLINRSMKNGKKGAAQKQVYAALDILKTKSETVPLDLALLALENIRPQMEVRSRRIGGAAYQVPVPVRPVRRDSLAIRWLIEAARGKPNKEYHTFAEKLAAEILDASQNTGTAIKKKLDMHRMAEANKAFAHFRW